MTYSRNPSRSWGSDYQKRNLTPFHLLSFCIVISKCDQLKWSSFHKIYTIFANGIVSLTKTKRSCKFCEWASLHKVTALTITSEDIWRLESQGKSSLHRREMCNDGTERQPQRREIRQQHVLHTRLHCAENPCKAVPVAFLGLVLSNSLLGRSTDLLSKNSQEPEEFFYVVKSGFGSFVLL